MPPLTPISKGLGMVNKKSSDMIGLFAWKASESADNSSQGQFDLTAEQIYVFAKLTPRSIRRETSVGVIYLRQGGYRAP